MVKPVFKTSLVLPQGCPCQFKVYEAGRTLWEFINDNIGFSIILYHVHNIGFFGSLSCDIGNEVQHENLICQAVFELQEFYKTHQI
ncbi:MAG TPA: hypothetical protein VEZ55_08080 [Chitinophagaceae bacterium]|jgi:hypothetical protein|nr:hypothetical protein [Chitinophagaceae bacterium]